MKTEHADIAGLRLHFARQERPGSPWLVLLAPWPHTLRSFERIWPLLAEHFSLLALDLPGFGASEVAPDRMTPTAQADGLPDILAHFGIEQPHLVATDVGVPAALSFAARYPGRLASLVVSDGPGTASPVFRPDLERMVRSSFVRWLLSWTPALFVRTAAQNAYQLQDPDPAALAHAVEVHRRPKMLANTLRYLGSYATELPDLEKRLGGIRVRTLCLWGTADVYVEPVNATLIADRVPDAAVVLLDGAGHFPHDDAPEAFAEAVRSFCLAEKTAPSERMGG